MKKILLLCDGDHFPSGAVRFIRQMRESDPIYVKGLFFSQIDTLETIPIGFIPISSPLVKFKENEKLLVAKSREEFEKIFENAGIKYDIHPYEGAWDVELFKNESRFADLVVFSEELFCTNEIEKQPNYFMTEALRSAECPAIVVPENFKSVERLVIAYDGEKESMHAIKQFVYLFPELIELPTEILHFTGKSTNEIPNRDLLREYAFAHFQSQYTSKQLFDPKKYLTDWLEEKKNALLVTGSFSRSAFSNTFHSSFSSQVISEHQCPVFIAHFS
jgi:hypothetical protein